MTEKRVVIVMTTRAELEEYTQAMFPARGRVLRPHGGSLEARHVYRVFEGDVPAETTFRDITGDVLVSTRSFATIEEAQAFVDAHHEAQRRVR